MMRFIPSLILLWSLSIACGYDANEYHPKIRRVVSKEKAHKDEGRRLQVPFIIGGTEADLNDYPYFASLDVGCGSALIAADILLTAAHCNTNGLEARVGPGRTRYDIVERREHPDFSRNLEYDFLLLRLESPVQGISPIDINSDSSIPSGSDSMVVVGYGATEEGGPLSSTFQEVTINHVPYAECADAYDPGEVDEPSMFCAGVEGGGKDSCQGDSGGPLIMNNSLVGLVSWGIGCAREEFPGVNARVSAASAWIQNQVCCMSSVPPSNCECIDDGTSSIGGGDAGGGGGFNFPELRGCFSEDTSVQVLGKGEVLMRELQIGDKVLTHIGSTTKDVYETVYAFGHYHPTLHAQFVQLFLESSDPGQKARPLEATGNHLLYMKGSSNPVRADSVKVGDALVASDGSHLAVTKVSLVQKDGIYAPLTPGGTIVVNNVLSSTYISLLDSAPEYMEGGLLKISQQKLCHYWMAPLRLLLSGSGDPFGLRQNYHADGKLPWVSFGMRMAIWFSEQNVVIQFLLLLATVIILGFLALLEMILGSILFVGVWRMLLTACMAAVVKRYSDTVFVSKTKYT